MGQVSQIYSVVLRYGADAWSIVAHMFVAANARDHHDVLICATHIYYPQ